MDKKILCTRSGVVYLSGHVHTWHLSKGPTIPTVKLLGEQVSDTLSTGSSCSIYLHIFFWIIWSWCLDLFFFTPIKMVILRHFIVGALLMRMLTLEDAFFGIFLVSSRSKRRFYFFLWLLPPAFCFKACKCSHCHGQANTLEHREVSSKRIFGTLRQSAIEEKPYCDLFYMKFSSPDVLKNNWVPLWKFLVLWDRKSPMEPDISLAHNFLIPQTQTFRYTKKTPSRIFSWRRKLFDNSCDTLSMVITKPFEPDRQAARQEAQLVSETPESSKYT